MFLIVIKCTELPGQTHIDFDPPTPSHFGQTSPCTGGSVGGSGAAVCVVDSLLFDINKICGVVVEIGNEEVEEVVGAFDVDDEDSVEVVEGEVVSVVDEKKSSSVVVKGDGDEEGVVDVDVNDVCETVEASDVVDVAKGQDDVGS